jgi:predicted small secreted protein
MKKLQNIFIAVVFGALATMTASAQNTTQGVGTVVRVEGIASYSLDGGSTWIPLVAGQHLPPGSQIHTGYNGVADVVLGKAIALPQANWQPDRVAPAADAPVRGLISYKPSAEQNVVRLTPNSTLAIDKLTIIDTGADSVGDTEINLTQGKILASVKKLSGASQYLIKIPNGVAGVRGTLFSISVDGTVVVFESHQNSGVVLSITDASGATTTLLIAPGFEYSPGAGGGSPINLTPQQLQVLKLIFAALPTIYYPTANYISVDNTCYFVSTTRGGSSGGSTPSPPAPR